MIYLLITALLFAYFLAGWIKISPVHHGVVYIFGRHGPQPGGNHYWGWVLKEGWHWVPPIIGKAVEYRAKFDPFNLSVTVYTKEKIGRGKSMTSLGITFRIQGTRRPDFELLNRFRKWCDSLEEDLTRRVEEKFQGIAGKYSAMDFIVRHNELNRFLNAILRLSDDKLPHLHGKDYGENEDEIANEKILDFYLKNRHEIEKLLNKEQQNPDRSYVEEYYGSDFGQMHLSAPDFDEQTKKAFALEAQTEKGIRAVSIKSKMAARLEKDHPGLGPQAAFDQVDHTLGAPKKIISVQGGSGSHLWISPDAGERK